MVTKATGSQAEEFSWVTGRRETRPPLIGLSQAILAFPLFPLSLSLLFCLNTQQVDNNLHQHNSNVLQRGNSSHRV